jgi:hypothetical protein
MNSPWVPAKWEPAIPQAMQQHGGRNRLLARKPQPVEAAPVPLVDAPALAPAVDESAESGPRITPAD